MKNNISIFLLGIFASICIGAGISNSELLTVKPTTPKSIVSFSSYRTEPEKLIIKINNYSNKGYILKEMVGSDYTFVVVMEKY